MRGYLSFEIFTEGNARKQLYSIIIGLNFEGERFLCFLTTPRFTDKMVA